MNESKLYFESRENEKSLKLRVIEALKSQSPEAQELLLRWTLLKEAGVTTLNTSRAAIEFNIERAEVYQQAECFNDAWDVLSNARVQAYQEGEDELFRSIEAKMDDLESLGEPEE